VKNLAHGSTKAALVGRDWLVRTLVAGGSRRKAGRIGRRRHDAVSFCKGRAEPIERGGRRRLCTKRPRLAVAASTCWERPLAAAGRVRGTFRLIVRKFIGDSVLFYETQRREPALRPQRCGLEIARNVRGNWKKK